MAFNAAGVAGAGELTLDARVGAVGLVVTNFTAVEAFASEAAASGLVGAFAGEVPSLATSVYMISRVEQGKDSCRAGSLIKSCWKR